MKLFKIMPVLLLALVFIFAGCSANNTMPNTTDTQQQAAPPDSSQESVSVPDTNQPSDQTAEDISYITAAEAEAAALSHAGVTADDVKNLRSEFDYDNGTAEYDVDFDYDGYEYDYDINAVTGEVKWYEKETEKKNDSSTNNTANNNGNNAESNTDNTSGSATLTAAEAEAIALKHAGYTANEVKGLRSEYDRDNGVYEYDIEFYAGGYEFDYEINAETGKIISFDKEWDD